MNITWKQEYAGVKVIVDKNCFTRTVKYRAVAVVVDVNRPNKVKPIFKRKRFETRTPAAYMVKGVGLLIHPDIYRKVQEKVRDGIRQQEREIVSSIFGAPTRNATSLSMANVEEALRRIEKAGKS
jgi:hypothetical protein